MLITKTLEPEEFNVARNPNLYYAFLDITNSITEKQESELKEIQKEIKKHIDLLEDKTGSLRESARNFMQETKISMKSKINRYSDLETQDDAINEYQGENLNYIVLMAESVSLLCQSFEDIYKFSKKLMPPKVLTDEKNKETFQGRLAEIQLNGVLLEQFINQIAILHMNSDAASNFAEMVFKAHEKYYQMLMHRHSTGGVKIFKDPVITDIAYKIFSNIDSHGEINSGKDQISAYTLRKAEILAASLKDPLVNSFISSSDKLINFIKDSIRDLDNLFLKLVTLYSEQINKLIGMGMNSHFFRKKVSDILNIFNEINPSDVTFMSSGKILSDTEKMQDEIESKTIEAIVDMLLDPRTNFKELVKYILDRKLELRKFFHDENSFYVCKIGSGNPFSGEAPGALKVVPAERPKGDIKWVLGSGYDEVREFADSITSSAIFHNLFLATSPSKTADKSNILMIGPPGCGKTQVMRSVAASKDSIAVFASGSDFLTCWKGEAEKNVKRLFEESIKISRESSKHVHILIDEIDSVLNNDRDMNSTNLTLEFQIMMDGVVNYPNISVWGATNHPERIPMAMMRRFSKTLIVGELEIEDRERLLRHYMGFLPLSKISEAAWGTWADLLDGATGDVIRKVADNLWREKMNWFVKTKPEKAREMVAALGEFSLDKFEREDFIKELRHHVSITANDIEKSIDYCLSNISIKHEIETAVETYKRSKDLLNSMD